MTTRANRRRGFAILAVLGIAILAAYNWNQNSLHTPNREHAMTELTKNMKTVCFGRYLVDIPTEAELSIATTVMDSVKIEYLGTSLSERIFKAKVERREAELLASKHNTEGTRLRQAIDINGGKQRLLVFREDQDDVLLTWVETSVHSGTDEWKISNDASEQYVSKTKNLVSALATQLVSRPMNEIPKVPGACVQNGLILGKSYQRENFPASMSVKSPAFTLGILSETSGPRERGQTLWDRIDKANSLGKEFFNATSKPLRRAEVSVDGRKGQEHVSTFQEDDVETFNADAEVYGDGTPKTPTLKVSMEVRRPIKPDPSSKEKTLSNDEALAVWDAVLKTIRPRPGAF